MKLLATLLVTFTAASVALNAADSLNLRKLNAVEQPIVLTKDAEREAIQALDLDHDKCTTIVVGPKAGIEGPMTTHTSDCGDCDFRISKVNLHIKVKVHSMYADCVVCFL